MKTKLFALLLTTAHFAHADAPIKSGDYTLGSCRISVFDYRNGTAEIRATDRGQFAQFTLNLRTGAIESINACNAPASVFEYSMSTSKKFSGNFTQYSAHCGGNLEGVNAIGSMTINNKTGEISELSAIVKIARASLPNGWHSGPSKKTASQIECR